MITQAALRDAPLIDQKFQDALPLLPGVLRGPDGNLNIKGTRPSQSGILVSSLNVTDPVTGAPAIELPLEAVDTVQVHSNPYSSEFGKFTGAVTTIETRSGSNDLRYLFIGVLPRPRWRDGTILRHRRRDAANRCRWSDQERQALLLSKRRISFRADERAES